MSLPTMPSRPEREGRATICKCGHRRDLHAQKGGKRLEVGCPLCTCEKTRP